MSEKTIWSTLKGINVEEKKMVEKKNNLSYISWAKAWSALCDAYPDATLEKHCNDQGFPYFKDDNGWCFTKVTVTVGDKSITEMLPVLNYANKPLQNPNSFEVNTSLQRCLAKAIALHGMGVQVYSGEDLPPSAAAQEQKSDIELFDASINNPDGEKQDCHKLHIKDVASKFIGLLDLCKTSDEVVDYWKANNKEGFAVHVIEKADKDVLATCRVRFKEKRDELTNKAKGVN
tara:strand:+ start:4070 stop:4765 length:696 start_codon:yes stop_codon:yes gene_type:complete